MPSVKLLIEDLERMSERLKEAKHYGLATLAVDPYNAEIFDRAAQALKEQRREVMTECAEYLDGEYHRVMRLQKAESGPLDDAAMSNRFIRMSAVLLPDIAHIMRARAELPPP